jgi:hypothetical protein
MTLTANKILPVALVAALLGGTAGAFITRSVKTTDQPVQTASTSTTTGTDASKPAAANDVNGENALATNDTPLSPDQQAYRSGFGDGFTAANGRVGSRSAGTSSNRSVSYRSARRAPRYSQSRAYYDYGQPKSRSFWDKHRDKLTVAMGAGGGALLGGLIGGKKGAAIGALSGAGGSALYTYKIRNRNRQY